MSRSMYPGPPEPPLLPDVTIVIPTFRRPDLLRRCVASCLAQEGLGTISVEILIVDNSSERSAEPIALHIARHAAWPVRYVHEPEPGISNSRNAGLRHAAGELIAFIDDDETASGNWLVGLLNTQRRCQSDVVFGPVLPFMPPEATGAERSRLLNLLTLSTEHPTGAEVSSTVLVPFWARRDKAYPNLASGNFLLNSSSDRVKGVRFDPRLGRTGGEDTLYFNQLLLRGSRFVWCAEAIAWEYVPPERLALRYALKRAFRGGQSVSMTPMLLTPKRPSMTLLAMAIAVAQIPFHLALAASGALMRSPQWHHHLICTMGAVGKLFWAAPFRAQVYGTGFKKPHLRC